jgi:autotransporter passenger strand-loop-strand repeat protein
MSVSSGGAASKTTVLQGGKIEVMSGGVDSGSTLSSGTEVVSSGGVSIGTVLSGGMQTVYGLTRKASIVNGAEQDVYGSAVATQVGTFTDQAKAVVEAGGAASQMTVYGQVTVYGRTAATSVMGTEVIGAGGRVSDSLVDYGQSRNAPGTEVIMSGGVAKATSVYGNQVLSFGGLAVSAKLYDGVQAVLSGGSATATIISGDGLSMPTQIVAGGPAVSTVLKAGFGGGGVALETVTAGGVAIGTRLTGGAKGVAAQVITSGGVASGTIIGSNRVQYVDFGGIANGTVVHADGLEIVSSGGKASATTLAGGTETVLSGGSIGAVTFRDDGTLTMSGTADIHPTIKGFASSDALDLASFAHKAGEKLSFAENAAKTGGVLTITDGTLTAAVTLFGQYAAAGFHIGGDGHGGTAITYAPPPHSEHIAEISPSPR